MHRQIHILSLFSGMIAAMLFAACPCPCQGAQSPSQAPGLSLSAEPSPAAVGGTVSLVLKYSLPPGAKLGKDPELKGIEGLSITGKEVQEGRIVLKVIADSLDPIRTGPVDLGYIDKAGKKGYLHSEGITITVVSNMKGGPDSGNLKPIRDIIPLTSPWIRWAAIIGIAALVAAALAGIILALKRLKRGGSSEAPAEPPHVRAEKDIDDLLRENLFEQGKQKEFYFCFTEIVKRYLEAIRGFPAAEYTTEEIAQRVVEQDRPVLSVLRYADLVKFADEIATPARKDEDVSCILAYIDVTAPGAEVEDPEKWGGGTA